MGTFAVLARMKLIEKITGRIEEVGRTTAGKIAMLPYRAPILPLGKGGEKKSIESMVGGLDVRKHIDTYLGDTDKTENARKLQKNADKRPARMAIEELKEKKTLTLSEAKRIAGAYGGMELKTFVNMNRNLQKEALMKSGADDAQAGKIIDEMKKVASRQGPAERPKTLAQREEQARLDAQAKAKADREAGVQAQPPATPGGTPTPPTPPAPPAPPTPPTPR